MKKQTVEFAVKKKKGVVQEVGKSVIVQPKTDFKGNSDSIKWYEDKPKQKND